ncbi:uncharacterized protein LOC113359325 [Papaver somniferum]|uniref:uncharacterized protein LOC113359325 n=1 Tax=Papaver somniferum TaxID=3469 RepID=UPI000E6FF149|nr:uncharacterized protein LOC113359325 [Papaver somniferum]
MRIIEIFFHFLNEDELILCCDEASRGNPGNAEYGFIARNHLGSFVFAETGGLGVTTNYVAEFMANIRTLEWAFENQKFKLILESDSKTCITSLIQQKIPWFLLARWRRILAGFPSISYRHVYREVNFSADHFAKKGVHLQKGQIIAFINKPSNLAFLEFPENNRSVVGRSHIWQQNEVYCLAVKS